MDFIRRMQGWFSRSSTPRAIPKATLLREYLDKARRAQYTSKLDEALEHLSAAMELAESEHDIRAQMDITLSRVDILIEQEAFDVARTVLTELIEETEAREMPAPRAYGLCSLGVIEQKQGNLDLAQEHYEKARVLADTIQTDGASGRASAHLADIYLIQGNASYAVYLLEAAVEKLNRSGDRELLGYFLGQLGLAQIQNGQPEKGYARLQAGLDTALVLRHHGQMRELNRLLGEQALKDAQYRKAKTHFEDALNLYNDSSTKNKPYVMLLCQLSKASIRLHDLESAKEHAEKALPLAEKLQDNTLIAMSKAVLGIIYHAQDDTNASTYLQDAVSAYDNLETDAFYIDVLRHLAKIQIEAGDAETGIATYNKAIEKGSGLGGASAQALSDLAKYYETQRDYKKSIELLQKALIQFEDVNQIDKVVLVLCDIATMYDKLGDGRMAQREYGSALEKLSRVKESQTRGILLANVAAAFSNYGDLDSAEEFFKESIEIAQRSKNKPAEALRRGNYGRYLALTNRGKQALTQLMQAETLSKEADLLVQAQAIHSTIGLAYANIGDMTSAEQHYQDALSALQEANAGDWVGHIYANLGDLALQQGQLDEAKSYYTETHQQAQTFAMIDVLVQVQIGLAQVAIQEDDLDTAHSKLTTIAPIARRQGHKRYLALRQQAMSQLLAKQGQMDEAVSAWEKAKKLRSIMRMPPITSDWIQSE